MTKNKIREIETTEVGGTITIRGVTHVIVRKSQNMLLLRRQNGTRQYIVRYNGRTIIGLPKKWS